MPPRNDRARCLLVFIKASTWSRWVAPLYLSLTFVLFDIFFGEKGFGEIGLLKIERLKFARLWNGPSLYLTGDRAAPLGGRAEAARA